MTVDEHIAEAKRLVSKDNIQAHIPVYSTQAIAHAAIASALLARYPGWGYCGKQPGEYDGVDFE